MKITINPLQYSRKPTKTISGVTPLAVMLPPRKCDHGTCLYCPSYELSEKSEPPNHQTTKPPRLSALQSCNHGTCLYCPSYELSEKSYPNASEPPNHQTTKPSKLGAPQSYTPQSPAVLRAKECNYDPIKQIKVRLESYHAMNHPTEKIELIIMGGTFLSYPKEFQIDFIKKCYQALNNTSDEVNKRRSQQATKSTSDDLEQAKKINETAKHRCTALCIETRPDVCSSLHIKDMLEYGATRVELGVQAIDDKIYKKVNRGHTVQDVIDATTRLKQAGFKIGYHLMPGIPGSNPKKDIQMFKKIFSSSDFKPDQIKIYPCQVLKGAGIENLYYGGEYIPYDKKTATDLIIKMLKITPRYCRIMRIMREIPPHYLIAGIKNIDMRHDIEKNIDKNKSKIVEIRFREIGIAQRDKREIDTNLKLKTTKYSASGGTEYFIEIINSDNILFGLLRLRLDLATNNRQPATATIRELHVYGQALNITESQIPNPKSQASQHTGLGKQLMQEAEKIAKKKNYKNIRVISGVGVREYYKKLGYALNKEKIYMEKSL